jgi:hypothetical protein
MQYGLAVHSLLHYQDEQTLAAQRNQGDSPEGEDRRQQDPELEEAAERQERCRIAVMSALFASREVQLEVPKALAAAE